jgi:N-acetylneuraminate synthase
VNVTLGPRKVGPGQPCYIVAEIGINHNGDVELAKKLIDAAAQAGCDAVKFQKRTPELAVPKDQWAKERDTPWGRMPYIDYKRRIEFGEAEYRDIDAHCRKASLPWFASPWDEPSVDFLERFGVPCHKIASASLTDGPLLDRIAATGKPIILSTGMSTMEEIDAAVRRLPKERLVILHSTSTYPAKNEELNLRCIAMLRERYAVPVGYSGHEVGLQASLAAVTLGACMLERHITMDRAMWGTDQAASVEPGGFQRLVRDVRIIEGAMGDGVKRVYEGEIPMRQKLRRA